VALIIHLHLAPVLKNEGWENDIKMDLQKVGWGETGRIYLAYDRKRWQALVNAGKKFSGSIKCEEFLDEMWSFYFLRKDIVPRVR